MRHLAHRDFSVINCPIDYHKFYFRKLLEKKHCLKYLSYLCLSKSK